jgi:hypothetical protein
MDWVTRKLPVVTGGKGSVAVSPLSVEPGFEVGFDLPATGHSRTSACGPIAGGRPANVRIRDKAAGHPDIGNDRYAAKADIHELPVVSFKICALWHCGKQLFVRGAPTG